MSRQAGRAHDEREGEPKWRRRKIDRPGEIINASLVEFALHGFERTRLDDVAARAGVAKGTIYRYFDSKEAVFEAAVRSRIATVLADVDALIDAKDSSAAEMLTATLTMIHTRIMRSDAPVLMRIIISEGHRFPALAERYHSQSIAVGQSLIRRIVAHGIERGEFRETPAADVPVAIVAPAIIGAIWHLTFSKQEPIDADLLLRAHVDLVLNGLLARR